MILFLACSLSAQNTFYKKYDFAGDDWGHFVIETSDGGYAIIGSTNSFGAGNYDVWLLKTNSSGDTLWTKTYGGPDNDEGNVLWEQTYFSAQSSSTTSICQININGFAVAGAFQMYPAGYWYPNIFTIDSEGNLGYQLTYMNLGAGFFQFIIGTTSDGFIFGGNENGENVVYKNLYSGVPGWDYRYESVYNTCVRAATQTSDNNIVIADNSWDGSLRKLDITTGDTLWTRTNSFNDDYPRYTNLTTTSDNGLIITGYTFNHGLILVKTMQNGSMAGIENQISLNKSISLNQNFPNPFGEQTELSFKLSKYESVELYITDTYSKRIKTLLNKPLAPDEYKYIWDGKNTNNASCPSGIYYAILKTKNGIVKTLKMIKY